MQKGGQHAGARRANRMPDRNRSALFRRLCAPGTARRKPASGPLSLTQTSLRQFDVARLPRLIEPRLERRIQAQK
jgi:hypothetical protein